ncbi:TonB-dependent receptor [uncultured Draconibacterium sp.]|uniref:TonB-dependent receptor n=1 Tax=uncultured Draconibacterium sp. TaxID=1573823 RepID=UPI0029C79640|nr:TonB-dependent receptor [uncultured Draconibacterium sp.]
MKITCLLVVIAFVQVSASTYAQSTKLTLEMKNARLAELFEQIEKTSEFRFFYDSDEIDLSKKVSISQTNSNIVDILSEVFTGTEYTYELMDRHIIVKHSGVYNQADGVAEAIQQPALTGKVTNLDGEPLPGVTVVVKGTTKGTVTQADGTYSLSNVKPGAILIFSFIGMETQEIELGNQTSVDVALLDSNIGLEEVIAIGYGTQKKESLTGAISGVSASDIEQVPAATVGSALAGKIAGVSFRMPDGRPGAHATIQIRNMGDPLYVIDGIQKESGHFNNLSPNDIESISVLKDASAAIYGVRAANGVVVVTTKRGKKGTKNTINVNAYTGWQNWSRFPETVGAYEWMLGKAYSEMNLDGHTNITPDELDKWKAGTETGYRSFDWYDFIIQPNAPQSSVNVSTSGGSDKINYYLSLTRLDQSSVLGREFTFGRTNFQSNLDAEITDRFKVGVSINGNIETRDNPGVPGGDDYWAPRFALFRNRPTERPFANDNPDYINNIGHMAENWGLLTKENSGYWTENWRALQMNFVAEYDIPIDGLTFKGTYSYFIKDRIMNGHEYTYEAYSYFPETDEYKVTFSMMNPWRERGTHKQFENVMIGQLDYVKSFGDHNISATVANERIERRDLDVWVHAVPKTNALPLIQFPDMDTYDDRDYESARIGYIGRFNYNYANKYYFEFASRYDASWKFVSSKRWGFFPSASAGWRITEEKFAKALLGESTFNLKFRGSYGELGDDNVGIGDFDYLTGYNYASQAVVMDGEIITGARDRGVPITSISWYTSRIVDFGADWSLYNGKLSGTVDYFHRKRDGLRGRKYDILIPNEVGYGLPDENVNSDATMGAEMSIAYDGNVGDFKYSVGGNISYARNKFLESYKPRFGNSWDHYRNSREDRWTGTFWGYEVVGQFESFEQINSWPVNNDGVGNRDMIPGDLIYKDVNQDGVINGLDERPIGFPRDRNPIANFGINLSAQYKGFDMRADFSGGSVYSYNQNWEMRWPYQNTGNLLKQFYDDRWHREDPYDLNSAWVPGRYPALRFNTGWHNNYNKQSTFWLTNAKYIRLSTFEIGYTLPEELITKVGMQRCRLYVSTYNLFSLDNLKNLGVEPEIMDPNGLQYPQNSMVNVGVNLSF